MKSQKDLILKGNWDNLILLDACRYDFFERIFEEYLDGNLKEVSSAGSSTRSWLRNTFGKKKLEDIVYVSSNPYVNSKGVEVFEGFNSVKHFGKIIDLWDTGWNEKLKTVPPEKVSKATRIARAKYPGKRIISHFMQPHAPYLSIGSVAGGFSMQAYRAKGMDFDKENFKFTRAFQLVVRRIAEAFLGKTRVHKIARKFGIGGSGAKFVAKEYGEDKLHQLYEENLRKVLREASELVKRLPGKSIVTSDHGELLGEEDSYGHTYVGDFPDLKRVPWLEV